LFFVFVTFSLAFELRAKGKAKGKKEVKGKKNYFSSLNLSIDTLTFRVGFYIKRVEKKG
jgi:hypothetical protein